MILTSEQLLWALPWLEAFAVRLLLAAVVVREMHLLADGTVGLFRRLVADRPFLFVRLF